MAGLLSEAQAASLRALLSEERERVNSSKGNFSTTLLAELLHELRAQGKPAETLLKLGHDELTALDRLLTEESVRINQGNAEDRFGRTVLSGLARQVQGLLSA
jgi:hypothetical protein